MGEAPAYAFRPRASAKRALVVPDLGEHPGAELDAEAGEAEDDLSVRVLRESLFDRLGESVGSGACGTSSPHGPRSIRELRRLGLHKRSP